MPNPFSPLSKGARETCSYPCGNREHDHSEGGITTEGQALGHRYVMGNVNAYCPKCSEEHGVCVLDCDYDLEK